MKSCRVCEAIRLRGRCQTPGDNGGILISCLVFGVQRLTFGLPRRSGFWTFVLGFLLGAAALFGLALFASLRNL